MLNDLQSRIGHDLGDLFDLLNDRRKTNQPTKGSGLGAPTHVPRNGDK